MIRLIVGLGNPGRQYEKTRHNAGFLFLDDLASGLGCDWTNDPRFQALFSECNVGAQKVMLLKPNTFMNRSGQAVGKIARYYKLMPDEVLVVHDELDFDIGTLRLKRDGGHGGHNGLRDIISHLDSKDFYRLRIGIGKPANKEMTADYVLSPPSKSDFELMTSAFALIQNLLNQIVSGDISAAMNKLNTQ